MPFVYSAHSSRGVDQVLERVPAVLAEHRFGLLWQLDVAETLAGKGFAGHEPLHVLEVCSPARADEALRADDRAAYLLPCRIAVRASGEGTEVGMLRPERLFEAVGADSGPLVELGRTVEGELRDIIDDLVR